MKWIEQTLFAYEDALFQGKTLDEIMAGKKLKFALSGLADLRQSLLIIEELYRQFPKLTVKELQVGPMDPIWLEQKDTRKQFSRTLKVPFHISQEKPSIKREPHGEVQDKPTIFHLATIVAFRLDYVPRTGDQILYRDTLYDITRTFVDPKDYFQQSGFPVYVRCESRVANFDSRNLQNSCEPDTNKRDAGAPAQGMPAGNVPSNSEDFAQPASDAGAKIFTMPI